MGSAPVSIHGDVLILNVHVHESSPTGQHGFKFVIGVIKDFSVGRAKEERELMRRYKQVAGSGGSVLTVHESTERHSTAHGDQISVEVGNSGQV